MGLAALAETLEKEANSGGKGGEEHHPDAGNAKRRESIIVVGVFLPEQRKVDAAKKVVVSLRFGIINRNVIGPEALDVFSV